jgi:hypothetical protein
MMLDPPAHFLVRNLDASGDLQLSLFNSDENRILTAEESSANISIRPTNLRPGIYYVSLKQVFTFPDRIHYEFVFSR